MSLKSSLLFKREVEITSPFGVNRQLSNGIIDKHDGVDYGVAFVPLYAPYDGVVIWEGRHKNGEIALWLEVDDYVLEFGHLNQTIVNIGDNVIVGQQIGVTGNSGYSTGPHLHVSCFPRGQENIWPRQTNGIFNRAFVDFETWEKAAPYPFKYSIGQQVQLIKEAPNMTQSIGGVEGSKLPEGLIDEVDQLSNSKAPTHPYHLKGVQGWVSEDCLSSDIKEAKVNKAVDGTWQDPIDQTIYPYFLYTVQEGDTLIKLAGKFLGDENKWQWIYHFNNNIDYNVIGDEPRLNVIGRQIKIPHF